MEPKRYTLCFRKNLVAADGSVEYNVEPTEILVSTEDFEKPWAELSEVVKSIIAITDEDGKEIPFSVKITNE